MSTKEAAPWESPTMMAESSRSLTICRAQREAVEWEMANSERAAERWKTAAAIAEKQALEEIEVAEGELKIALTHISKTEWKVKAVADENERLKEEIRVMKEGLEGDRIARSQHDAVLSKQQSLISYINQLSETGDLSMVDTSRMSCVNEIMLKIEQEEGGD